MAGQFPGVQLACNSPSTKSNTQIRKEYREDGYDKHLIENVQRI